MLIFFVINYTRCICRMHMYRSIFRWYVFSFPTGLNFAFYMCKQMPRIATLSHSDKNIVVERLKTGAKSRLTRFATVIWIGRCIQNIQSNSSFLYHFVSTEHYWSIHEFACVSTNLLTKCGTYYRSFIRMCFHSPDILIACPHLHKIWNSILSWNELSIRTL